MNLFLIEPCVKILNVINDLLSFSYDRAGGEVIVVVVETSPVEVIFQVVGVEDHWAFEKGVFEDQGWVVGDADIADAEQFIDIQICCYIHCEIFAVLGNFRAFFYERVVFQEKNVFISKGFFHSRDV